MSEQPKRRFCQLHLSTALLMMLSLSFLLFQNVTPIVSHSEDLYGHDFEDKIYGWPWMFMICTSSASQVQDRFGFRDFSTNYKFWKAWPDCGLKFVLWNALPNLIFALGILSVVALFSEWRIRRREGHRP